MNTIRICPHNFFDEATLVESPAMVTTMPATFAQLTARDKSARSTSNAAQTIKGTWGGEARKINSFFVFRHNGQGGEVQIKLYPNADYTGTPYDSTALDLFTAITSEGYDWGIAASAPDSVNDLLGAESSYSSYFATFTAKSFEIIFTNCARSYWDIGRIWFGKYMEAECNPLQGMTVSEITNDQQTRTKGGSLRTRAGEKWHEVKFDTLYLTDDARALWRDLISYVQLSRDVAMSLYPGFGGRMERDHVFDMQYQAPSPFAMAIPGHSSSTYSFTEV